MSRTAHNIFRDQRIRLLSLPTDVKKFDHDKMNHSEEFVLESKPKVIHCFLHLLTELLHKKLGRSYYFSSLVVGLLGYQKGWEIILFPSGVFNKAANARPTYKKPPTIMSPTRILLETLKCFFTYYLIWFSHQLHFHSEGLSQGSEDTQDSRVNHLSPSSWAFPLDHDPPFQSSLRKGLNSEVLRHNSKYWNSEVS